MPLKADADCPKHTRCSVFERTAKRAFEHLVLEDLRCATQFVARTVPDLLRVRFRRAVAEGSS